MFEGKVVLINITPVVEGPMHSVNEVRAIPGRGLEGDRYFDYAKPEPRRELTLVEAEAIEALRSELKLTSISAAPAVTSLRAACH